MKRFLRAFNELPARSFVGLYEGRRYFVSVTSFAGGRALKLVAEEAGGNGYISFNLYLSTGAQILRPCEMPEAKVMRFVKGLKPEQGDPVD